MGGATSAFYSVKLCNMEEVWTLEVILAINLKNILNDGGVEGAGKGFLTLKISM